jgi:hypothetical protein
LLPAISSALAHLAHIAYRSAHDAGAFAASGATALVDVATRAAAVAVCNNGGVASAASTAGVAAA